MLRWPAVAALLLVAVIVSVGATLAAIRAVPDLAPAGAQGPRGPAGPPGEPGIRGPRGPAGADGATVAAPPGSNDQAAAVDRFCRVFQAEYLNRYSRHPDVAALATELYEAC